MKLAHGATSANTRPVNRVTRFVRDAFARLGIGREQALTPRERYERALDASTITEEQRQRAFANAAAAPGLEAALDEADRAIEEYVKGAEAGELHGRYLSQRRTGH